MLTGQSQIRLHANNVPTVNNNPMGERPQISELAKVEEEDSGTLAALPVRHPAPWQHELPRYQALTSSQESKFDPHPATPERGSQRYKPRKVSQSVNPPVIPAGQQRLLSALPLLPEGWRRHVHPEGNVFFYHEGLRIFTESDIIDIKREKQIFFYATKLIQQAIQTGDVILDELTEVVLNVDDSQHWHYYFVDHKHRLLFWVHPVQPREHLDTNLQGYLAYDMELRSHCEYYPHNRTLPKRVFEDLRGMLNYAKTDMMTTDSSSSPFAQDELVAILDLVNSLKDTPLFGKQTWNRGVVFKVVNALLFGSPNEYAIRLQRVWVDGIIIQPRWKDFINRLTAELGRYTIFSTVMLAVNFSFLGVITSGAPASPIRLIIYCSVVSTVGSIIFSFALLKVYSNPQLTDANSAAEAMRTLNLSKWGMACFAITHSLPIACLVWSIALFSTALAIEIFGSKELATVTTLGVECLILVLSGFMSMVVMRLFSRDDDVDDADTSGEEISSPTRSQADVEQGSGKMMHY
ncbi:hypothetical protein J3R83DRAFT_14023 [Lanmaoa asiatica]|nr:hypothetical protein J3R83DRAFT_14023 [Lanmaoa asiatica]